MKKTILLGVTGGIAAFKVLDLVRLLKKQGKDVAVIMTENASKMIAPQEFEKLGVSVYSRLFEDGFDYRENLKKRRVEHIDVADSASLLIIAPATANVIAKLAYGIADDYLTTVALALTCPIMLFPSMNVNMWHNPIVAQNLAVLRLRGFIITEPDTGLLACGYTGEGRLVNIEKIAQEIEIVLRATQLLKGKKIIITAGPTQEKIDDARFITNKSSGKMGAAIAEACYLAGADVLLLRANSSVAPRYLINEQTFNTAEQLKKLLEKYAKDYDVIFHTAAVSDFRVNNSQKGKISSDKPLYIDLQPQEKIINLIKNLNPSIFLIAFKAEYGLSEEELVGKARKKLVESLADAVVANDVGKSDRGFQADTNEVTVVLKDGNIKRFPLQSKREIAKQLVDFLFGE